MSQITIDFEQKALMISFATRDELVDAMMDIVNENPNRRVLLIESEVPVNTVPVKKHPIKKNGANPGKKPATRKHGVVEKKICPECSIEFHPTSNVQKYCSIDCGKRHKGIIPRVHKP